ncbi:hypothetical protein [Streptomyces vinaceus]|uniref:hypothetical protein n=1 Tax=Streptomyces vinaceus TaxID=1960 RepID=UPI00368A1012
MSNSIAGDPAPVITGSVYTAAARADHEERCDRCRALTEAAAAFAAANGASMARRDRKQLGLGSLPAREAGESRG